MITLKITCSGTLF